MRRCEHGPRALRRLPLQPHGAALVLVFKVVEPERIAAPAEQENLRRSLAHLLATTHPRIDERHLALRPRVVASVTVAVFEVRVHIQPSAVGRAHFELIHARLLREERAVPRDGKLVRFNPLHRASFAEVEVQHLVLALQHTLGLLVHPVGLKILRPQPRRCAHRLRGPEAPDEVRDRLAELPIREPRQLVLRGMIPRPRLRRIKRGMNILRNQQRLRRAALLRLAVGHRLVDILRERRDGAFAEKRFIILLRHALALRPVAIRAQAFVHGSAAIIRQRHKRQHRCNHHHEKFHRL